jgi:tetratricopeptide (TPR) repeat protein
MAVMNIWLEMARSQFQADDLDAALGSVNQALQVESTADAWALKERILTEKATRGERAIGGAMGVAKATEDKPNNNIDWNAQGIALSDLGRYEEAIDAYNKAIEIKPDYHEVWYNRGIVLSALGRKEEAIGSYEKAIEISPNFHEAWTDRGAILCDCLGQYEEAVNSFEKALKIKPDFYQAWFNCGIALSNLGRYNEAIDSYDKVIDLNPYLYDAWINRGAILCDRLGRYEEAVNSFEKALEIKPDDHDAWYNRGVSLSALGRNEEAIASYDQALEIKPNDPRAWYNRGVSLSALGRNKEAIASYDQALEFKPDYPEAWYGRGIPLYELGRNEEAIVSYKEAIEIKPDFYAFWLNLGNSLSKIWQKEEAIAFYDKAIELRFDSHYAWASRGDAAARSRSSTPYAFPFILNQPLANLPYKHPELNQRGYDGQVASLTVGLTYCPAHTHPLSHGFLQQQLGDAHWKNADRTSPRSKFLEALTHYEQSEKVLTIADHPEERLQTLQRLVRVHFALNTPTETLTALIRQGAELRDRILTQAKSQPHRDRLHRTLPNFNEFTVDLLLRQGETIRAIETAEADKNGLMKWLLPSTETPNYQQMRQWIAHRTVVYWHFSANALTTFILTAERDRPIVLPQPDPETALKQRNELETWIENWNKNYNTHLETSKKEINNADKTRSEWQNNLETELEKLATILDIPTLITHLSNTKL